MLQIHPLILIVHVPRHHLLTHRRRSIGSWQLMDGLTRIHVVLIALLLHGARRILTILSVLLHHALRLVQIVQVMVRAANRFVNVAHHIDRRCRQTTRIRACGVRQIARQISAAIGGGVQIAGAVTQMPVQLSVSGAQLIASIQHLVLHLIHLLLLLLIHVRRLRADHLLIGVVIKNRINRRGGRIHRQRVPGGTIHARKMLLLLLEQWVTYVLLLLLLLLPVHGHLSRLIHLVHLLLLIMLLHSVWQGGRVVRLHASVASVLLHCVLQAHVCDRTV